MYFIADNYILGCSVDYRAKHVVKCLFFSTFSEEDNMIAVCDTCSTTVLREDITSVNATNLF